VVVGQSDHHDGPDDNLAVNDNRLVFDRVHAWGRISGAPERT
jgi:hypothetical protein